jgi:uncharacterized membrane protein YfcA
MNYLVIALASLIAGTLDTVAGFGGTLLLLPVLVLKIGGRDAVLLSSLISLGWNITRVMVMPRSVNWRAVWLFTIGILPGALVGAYLFQGVDPSILNLAIALTVILFGAYYILRLYVELPALKGGKPATFPLFGLVSGIAASVLGAGNGPIQVWGMSAAAMTPREIAITGGALGAITGVARLFGYGVAGQLHAGLWIPGAVGLIMAIGGSLLGIRLSLRSKDTTLELVIGLVLVLAGIRMLL